MAKKILVVDDSPTDLKLISRPLQASGYLVETATDGEEALTKVGSTKPDLVILDVVMPRKNGYQVCRQIKSTADTSAIKVILLTSKNQESDRFWGLKQGADAYLTKPFVEADLLSQIKKLA
jgi:DNA-binding response OmpR family regulator